MIVESKTCLQCKAKFVASRQSRKEVARIRFCSRQCAGKHSAKVMGKTVVSDLPKRYCAVCMKMLNCQQLSTCSKSCDGVRKADLFRAAEKVAAELPVEDNPDRKWDEYWEKVKVPDYYTELRYGMRGSLGGGTAPVMNGNKSRNYGGLKSE